MKRQSLILPVVLATLLISGCNRRGTTESTTPTSSTPTSSQTSSETSSQGTSVSESSSEEQSSQGSSSEEQGTVYTVTIGETQHTLAEGEAPTGYLAQYYVEGLTVTKDQAIAFKEDGVNLNVHKDNEGDTDESKCNAVANEQGDFVIHNDATNVGVYLKLDADQNWAFWVTGYVKGEGDDPTPGLAQYVLIETGEELEKVQLVANPGDNTEVMAKGVELDKDQQVALCLGDNDWRKYDDINAEAPGLAHVSRHNQDQDASDGNIVINDKGTYDFYIKKVKENNAKTIWLVYNLPAPSADAVATVKVNAGEAKTIAKVEDAVLLNTQVAEYKTTISVAKDDELTFFLDDEAIVKYGAEPDDEEHHIRNNVQGNDKVNEGKLVVLKDATDVELIFKTWENGGCSMWLAGGPELVKVAITFQMTKDTGNGKSLYVAGSFSNWGIDGAVALNWATGNVWSGSKEFIVGSEIEFKFVIAATDNPTTIDEWENLGQGVNRTLTVSEAATVVGEWGVAPAPAPVEHFYGLVGKYSTYNWDNDAEMTVSDGKATIESVAFEAGDLFKVREDRDWEVTYGWAEVKASTAGTMKAGAADNNIEVVVAGSYDIQLTIATGKLMIKTHGSEDPVPAVVTVTFKVTKATTYGDSVFMVGADGDWTARDEYIFTWSTGDVWTLEIELEAGQEIGFKLVTATESNHNITAWEKEGTGNERHFTPSVTETVNLTWGSY